MAQTPSEIYDIIQAEKQNEPTLQNLQPAIDDQQTLLEDLSTPSYVGVWRLFTFLWSVILSAGEILIELIASREKPGTALWWEQLALQFQFGDPLVEQDGQYVYSPVVVANRVVKVCKVVEDNINGGIIIKIATILPGNVYAPLPTLQFDAFKAYIGITEYAGTKKTFINSQADILKVGYDVYYDPQILAPNGSLLSDPAVFPVENAIQAHIKNLPFNGLLLMMKMTNEVEKAAGVINAVNTMAQAKIGINPYVDILSTPGQTNQPFAGYFNISTAPGETLTTTINYIPYV